MSDRRTAVAAAGGWSLTIGGAALGLAIRAVEPVPFPENPFDLADSGIVALAFLATTWATVGALLLLRVPDNAVGRWVLVVGLGHGLSVLGGAVAAAGLAQGPAGLELARWAGWLTGLAVLLGSGVFYLALVFPTGRGHTRAWDVAARTILAMIALTAAIIVTRPGPLHLFPRLTNPIGFGPDLAFLTEGTAGPTVLIGVIAFAPPVIAAMASRYRAGGPVERAQLRWFVSAIVLTLATLVVMGVASIAGSGLGDAPLVAFGVAAATVPLAIGVAILRYHLYEIDRIVSRTIAWALTTGSVLALFALLVLAISTTLGSATSNTPAVAVSTLVAAALFQPLRSRVQTAVDRRFNRAHVDATQTVDAFLGRLRDDVTIDVVASELRATVRSAVQPASQGLWLRAARELPR